MKLSELINTLVELAKKHGDIEVRAYGPDDDDREGPVTSVRHMDAVNDVNCQWPEHVEISYDVELL